MLRHLSDDRPYDRFRAPPAPLLRRALRRLSFRWHSSSGGYQKLLRLSSERNDRHQGLPIAIRILPQQFVRQQVAEASRSLAPAEVYAERGFPRRLRV